MLVGSAGSPQYGNSSGNAAFVGPGEPRDWQGTSDAVIARAISRYNLSQVGWRGFEDLAWVKDLKQRNPQVGTLATQCSSHDRASYTADLEHLMDRSSEEDKPSILAYFSGKLALEELSCRRSGAGAGMCDKRGAYLDIVRILQEQVR